MVSQEVKDEHIKAIQETIEGLKKFGLITDLSPTVPCYHGYLGTTTNATIYLLYICLIYAGEPKLLGAVLKDNHWLPMRQMVHRMFFNNIVSTIEVMCVAFSKRCGNPISEDTENFMDYINLAMSNSKLGEDRKDYWRKKFHVLRIIRNKASHSNQRPTEKDIVHLKNAEVLEQYVEVKTNRLIVDTLDYIPTAQMALDFIIELETSLGVDLPPITPESTLAWCGPA